MRLSRLVSTVCVGLALSLAAVAENDAAASQPVYKVAVDGIIHGVSAERILQVIGDAEQHSAELVLIQLDTPGGLLSATEDIIQGILGSSVPVVVYVAPPGARAASAGFLIAMAADVAAMAPGTNTGAATPVSGTGAEIEETMEKKIRSDAAARTRSLAAQRGRDGELADNAVTDAQSWTAAEALEAGLIDIVASTQAELLDSLDGRTVRRIDGREQVLATASAEVIVVEMTWIQHILSVVANPNIALLLGMIGLGGLYLEFTNPGAIVPGVVGAIALLLAAFAFQVLPVNIVGVLLLLVGFGLLIAEALTPAFGVLGTGGIVGILFGALMLFKEPEIPTPALQVSWTVILPVTLVLAALVVVVGRKVVEAQRRPALTGLESLVGKCAVARTEFAGSGKVFIHGEFWDALSQDDIHVGECVKVTGVDGLMLNVERAPEA